MAKPLILGLRWAFAGGVLLGGLAAGPSLLADPPQYYIATPPCGRVPPGAIPAPNGTYVNAWMNRQAEKAAADDFVVYRNEWYMGGIELGPYGLYHLHQIAKRLDGVPFPIVIQPDAHHAINEARRMVIVTALIHAGFPDVAQRVVIEYPQAEGLYGDTAPRLYQRFIGGGAQGTGQAAGGGALGGLGGSTGIGLGGSTGIGVGGIR